MNDFKSIAIKHFQNTDIKIDLPESIERLESYEMTNEELDEFLGKIKKELPFFYKELGNSWNGIFLSNLISYTIDALYVPKLKWNGSKNRKRITSEYSLLLNNQSHLIENEPAQSAAINPIAELNSLIGLNNIKSEIKALKALASVRKMKIEQGIPVLPHSLHLVFMGNPGTGKTTVARLIGRIYADLGLLSEGHLIEASRSDLVAKYVGHTAPLVEKKYKEAMGGVLFIDEAYSLTKSNSGNDFGTEAVETLLKLMEDVRENTVVIVAGYPAEMSTFINSNPGLKSRFPTYINFEDYSTNELTDIFKLFVDKDGHRLTDSAKYKLSFVLEEELGPHGNEGNARFIRNLYEKVIRNQAERISKEDTVGKSDLLTIIDEDIPDKLNK